MAISNTPHKTFKRAPAIGLYLKKVERTFSTALPGCRGKTAASKAELLHSLTLLALNVRRYIEARAKA